MVRYFAFKVMITLRQQKSILQSQTNNDVTMQLCFNKVLRRKPRTAAAL